MNAAALNVDVGPWLDTWLEQPTKFAEKVVFQRPLAEWERQRVVDARWRIEILPETDRIEALNLIAAGMRQAIGSSSSGMRKRQHLKTLRHFRAHPENFVRLEYRHRFIRTRCGKCRALYATETFISFADRKHGQGRRMYVTERETLLDCGHPSMLLYPVEWEADGYVSPSTATADA